MAVGLASAGFRPAALYEKDPHACETLRRNSAVDGTLDGVIVEQTAEEIDWSHLTDVEVRLLAAGTPCQPFSIAGKHKAERDSRNLFAELSRAVRALRPKAVLVENVRGLLRPCFSAYFDYILHQLEAPSHAAKPDEDWRTHHKRLLRFRRSVGYAPEYNVQFRFIDAADFGVPQRRCRVFIVAVERGYPAFVFPEPSHSRLSLLRAKSSGEYWERHGLRPVRGLSSPELFAADGAPDLQLPWTTVRDAISSLPEPSEQEADAWRNHWNIPGARSYTGHTGSILDWPSKTIKAGVHGVPGGENSITDDRGRLRYYTLREAARLQCFPDEHVFCGARIQITRQIGNAVPCVLAKLFGKALHPIISSNAEESAAA